MSLRSESLRQMRIQVTTLGDLLLLAAFRNIRPPEETPQARSIRPA